MVNEIDPRHLQARIEAGEDLHVLDIRTKAEVTQGALPNAQHLPMHLIPFRIGEFAVDREIVLYCRSGARSYHACSYLAQQGYTNVINLRGGIIDWARSGFQVERWQAS